MHNFVIKFIKILDIYKKFAGNRVDKNWNRPHCGVVPKISDMEVIALSAMTETFGFDRDNYLFTRLNAEKEDCLPNQISRRQYNQRRILTAHLGEVIFPLLCD
ncbi:MAG: hypothetical protein K2G85_08525 [Muribaculaceae bacterium]|nr:hypothetical protein [Muribaculaceae bacterium]